MPLHLEAPQYILQLVGQRQRMSLHLGGTAIHLAIGRAQMQAVKKSIIQRRKNLPSKISVLAGKQSNKRCTRIFNLPRSTLRGEKSGICCSQIGNNIGVEFCNNANQQKGRSPSGKWKYDIGRIRKTTKPITNFVKIKNHTKGNEQDHLREAVKTVFLRTIPK